MEIMDEVHAPVLLKEVTEYLDLKPGMNIIDATLDGGGHSAAILEKIGPTGKVLGVEIDPELFKETSSMFQVSGFKNFILVNDSYVNIKNIVREYNFRPNAILFDLGLSSWHYEKSRRGFSFKRNEMLDMRYCTRINTDTQTITERERTVTEKIVPKESVLSQSQSACGVTAAEIVNIYSKEKLDKVFREYGEEQFAENIAENIVSARKQKPIMTTGDLVEIISYSVPAWYKKRKIHFATKIFQALRIAVNEELKNVSEGVSSAIDVLVPGGRLAVISFHGLEDKIVREIFKKKTKEGVVKFVVKGTIRPSWEEAKKNPRARSAKMKVVEKLNNYSNFPGLAKAKPRAG